MDLVNLAINKEFKLLENVKQEIKQIYKDVANELLIKSNRARYNSLPESMNYLKTLKSMLILKLKNILNEKGLILIFFVIKNFSLEAIIIKY